MGDSSVAPPATPPVPPKRKLRLTLMDHHVLQTIATNGFQTYAELRQGCLKEAGRTWAWDRLRRLSDENLLHECRDDKGALLGWALHPNTNTEVIGVDPETMKAAQRVPHYKTSFQHDLALRDVRSILIQSSAITRWIPEHALKREIARRYHYLTERLRREKLMSVPDALLHIKSGRTDSKAALELELTRKSKKRLSQKFEEYALSSEIGFAFFVVKGEKLLRFLSDVHRQTVSNSVRIKLSRRQNGIYFVEYSELKRRGLDAGFVGIEDRFTLRELAA